MVKEKRQLLDILRHLFGSNDLYTQFHKQDRKKTNESKGVKKEIIALISR